MALRVAPPAEPEGRKDERWYLRIKVPQHLIVAVAALLLAAVIVMTAYRVLPSVVHSSPAQPPQIVLGSPTPPAPRSPSAAPRPTTGLYTPAAAAVLQGQFGVFLTPPSGWTVTYAAYHPPHPFSGILILYFVPLGWTPRWRGDFWNGVEVDIFPPSRSVAQFEHDDLHEPGCFLALQGNLSQLPLYAIRCTPPSKQAGPLAIGDVLGQRFSYSLAFTNGAGYPGSVATIFDVILPRMTFE